MFTGIIEDVGTIRSIKKMSGRWEFTVFTALDMASINDGDSIAVDGVCLTVIRQFEEDGFVADASLETLNVTTLKDKRAGDRVNLERAMRADGRWGGHFVTGHVDATGRIASIRPSGLQTTLGITLPQELLLTVVEKGSIAIDGVSLTVAALRGSTVEIAVIPHTWQNTVCHTYRVGERVNVETDMIGKYVAAFVRRNRGAS